MKSIASMELSNEARDLLERSLEWLQPKGRWNQGWGAIKKRISKGRYLEYYVDEPDEFHHQSWKTWEEYKEDGDYILPFKKYGLDDFTSACALGSLLINNRGRRDAVYVEAARALANLVIDTRLKENPNYLWDMKELGETEEDVRERLLYDYDKMEETVIEFNDAGDTEGTTVKNLFRRILGRKTY